MKFSRTPALFICSMMIVLVPVLFTGCATVRDIANPVKPELNVKDVHLTGLNFEAVDLAVAVEVRNPNRIALPITGFDYEVKINDTSFLKGQQAQQQQIASLGAEIVQIPVTLKYKNLYDTFTSLSLHDATAYTIDCGVLFDIPGLGALRVPLSAQGDIPTVKLPDLDVEGLKVTQLSLTGADLDLKVRLKNPNAFALLFNSINYELAINGNSWVKGNGATKTEVTPKGEATLHIPMSLNFKQIGGTVAQLLAGQREVTYQFQGQLGVGSSLPFFKQTALPFARSGSLKISR